MLATPLNLYRDKDESWHRADPLAEDLPGWEPHQPGRRPLWHRGGPDAKRPGDYLRPTGIAAFLRGESPADEDWVRPDCLFGFDHRTGLEIDANTLTGVEGRLFATRLLALKPGVGFYAEVLSPGPVAGDLRRLLAGPFPWGGEGRYATACVLEQPAAWPSVEEGGNPLWLLASPAPLGDGGPGGRLPDRLAPDDLVAVASGPGMAVSGWDLARGSPRPTRFAAPAGSVYFTTTPAPSRPRIVALRGSGGPGPGLGVRPQGSLEACLMPTYTPRYSGSTPRPRSIPGRGRPSGSSICPCSANATPGGPRSLARRSRACSVTPAVSGRRAMYESDGSEVEPQQRRSRRDKANEDGDLVTVFGPASRAADKHSGALSLTDARCSPSRCDR